MATLLDSYSEANIDDFDILRVTTRLADGNTFLSPVTIPLHSVKWFLLKVGSPSGNIFAKIYNLTGTVGTNGKPTGSPIATSDPIDISTLTGSYQGIEFKFTGSNSITLNAGSHYGVSIEYYTGGDSSNYLQLGLDSSSPSWSNNSFLFISGSWSSTLSADDAFPFYIYGQLPTGQGVIGFE